MLHLLLVIIHNIKGKQIYKLMHCFFHNQITTKEYHKNVHYIKDKLI